MSLLINAQNAIGTGDFGSARRLLKQHLQSRPLDADALYFLGICEQASNRTDDAREIYIRILKSSPGHFGAHYNLALLLSGSGRDSEALPHHDAAVRLQPQQFWAYINRGNAKSKLGQFESALKDYELALAINPQVPEAYTNLGNALRELGRHQEALTAHEKALAFRPRYPVALANQAAVLVKLNRPEDALASADVAIQMTPEFAEAWSTRGVALSAIHRHAEALASYEQALRLHPDYAEAWLNKGAVLTRLHRSEEAVACYDRALQLRPDYPEAWMNRGIALEKLKDTTSAVANYEKALSLRPDMPLLIGMHLYAKRLICDWHAAEQDLRRLMESLERGNLSAGPLEMLTITDDPAMHGVVSRLFADRFHPSPSVQQSVSHQTRTAKIRLGYYSADFRAHPVGLLICELLEQADKSKFELTGFSFGSDTADPLHQRISRAFDRFIDVRDKSDQEVAQLSRELGIDIAVNLGGYTDGNRTDIFAFRAAPIQVSYLGYPGTMGAEYMDYLIADQTVCPPDSQVHYTEKLAYLPHCFMPHDSTQKISDKVFSRQDFNLPDSGFVFCCFNNHNKINPRVFDIWTRLLEQVPGSVLWLSNGSQTVKDNLTREAAARGVEPQRIIFAPRLESMAEHLARYRLADLFIDTLPYNAHTTACDALWAGVPVLTCAGESFASRVAASLLHTIGLPELVTHSLDQYEALALQLAHHPQQLAAIRQKLAANRLSSPLFDTPRLARNIERLYSTMLQRILNSQPPEQISA